MNRNNKDKVSNWYEKIDKEFTRKPKLDKNFKNHLIEPCSMICVIGPTGSGKSNALLDFLNRKDEAFYKIIVYTGSTNDEPLYNFLQNQIPETEFYRDINELPSLTDFEDDDKSHEKLIVFDDFINLNKKEFKKIQEYLTAGRKYGFTCFCLAQNYVSIPKTITRNCHYFILFKLNDNSTCQNIIRNHNIDGIDNKIFKEMYINATNEPRSFFMLDLKNPKYRYRQNFLNLMC